MRNLTEGLIESLDVVEQKFLYKLKNKKIEGISEDIIRVAFPGLLPVVPSIPLDDMPKVIPNKKRGRGRPKKPVDPNAPEKPKRKRGRPKKVKTDEPAKPKRPRGRPRKVKVDPEVQPAKVNSILRVNEVELD